MKIIQHSLRLTALDEISPIKLFSGRLTSVLNEDLERFFAGQSSDEIAGVRIVNRKAAGWQMHHRFLSVLPTNVDDVFVMFNTMRQHAGLMLLRR